MRLPTRVVCPTAEVAPGGTLECRLQVYNAADRVDEVVVTTQGRLAPLVTVTPPSLSLLPGKEGAFAVRLDLDVEARLEAGTHPLLLEVGSGLVDVEPSLEEVDVEVARFTAAALTLRERDLPGVGPAVEARVDSGSNHSLDLELLADAPVAVEVDPQFLQLGPFESATATLTPSLDPHATTPVELTVRAVGEGVEITGRTVLAPVEVASAPPPPPVQTEPDATEPVTVVAPPPSRPSRPPAPSPPPRTRRRRARLAVLVALVALVALALVAVLLPDVIDGDGVPDFDVRDFPDVSFREDRDDASSWDLQWQLMLLRRGYELGADGADGRFGPLTRDATIEFQEDEGLRPDGVVDGPEWRNMLLHYWELEEPSALQGWRPDVAQLVQSEWET